MKRVLSFFLSVLMIFSICSFAVFAEDEAEEKTATVRVGHGKGFASQLVTVFVDVSDAEYLYGATVKIKYDKRLELVSVSNPTQANGGYFTNQDKSAIYKQGGGGINGEYTYVGITHTGEAVRKEAGIFTNLTFRIPQNAKVGDSYSIKVESSGTKLATGIDSEQDFIVSNGSISVLDYFGCGGDSHSFAEVVESQWSDLSTGYIRNTCSICGYTDITINEPTSFEAITYEGAAINHTGKPSGIAPIFTVNMSGLNYYATVDSTFKQYDIEAGLMVLKNGEIVYNELFYEEGKKGQDESDSYKVYTKLENVSVYDKFEFRAYIKISDKSTNQQRVEYVIGSYNGKEEITILDIVQGLNVKLYPKESQSYLDKIKNGLGQ